MTTEQGKKTRHYPCFVEAFTEAGCTLGIPESYVRWGGIFAIATALGRHVWAINAKGETFPNLYVMMVGPPGTGKTQTEDLLIPFFQDLGIRLTAQHMTKAALIDEIVDRRVIKDLEGEIYDYHHAVIVSSEFAETFEGYNIPMLSTLARWWDCPAEFRERKRHLAEPIVVQKICCNLLTGVQPGILAHHFPISAWTGGFLSRTIFVYVPQPMELLLRTLEKKDLVLGKTVPEKHYTKLVKDLNEISMMLGQMTESSCFLEEYLRWARVDQKNPRPKHPRLYSYNIRREHQLEKLSMIAAASRGSMLLEGRDYIKARSWLETVELNLDEVFLEMAISDDSVLMGDLHQYLWKLYFKNKEKPIMQYKVWQYLASKMATQRIGTFLEAASRAGYLRIDAAGDGSVYITPLETIADID